MTSNPTIFEKAMTGSTPIRRAVRPPDGSGRSRRPSGRWRSRMSTDGLRCSARSTTPAAAPTASSRSRCRRARPRHRRDDQAAQGLHARIALPNLLVKIPATEEGIPAIRQMIARPQHQRHPHLHPDALRRGHGGLPAAASRPSSAGGDLRVHSVASFFVSRVDTEVDRRLEEIGRPRRPGAAGKGRRGPGPPGLRAVRGALLRPALGGSRARGAPIGSARSGRRRRPRTRPTRTCCTSTS